MRHGSVQHLPDVLHGHAPHRNQVLRNGGSGGSQIERQGDAVRDCVVLEPHKLAVFGVERKVAHLRADVVASHHRHLEEFAAMRSTNSCLSSWHQTICALCVKAQFRRAALQHAPLDLLYDLRALSGGKAMRSKEWVPVLEGTVPKPPRVEGHSPDQARCHLLNTLEAPPAPKCRLRCHNLSCHWPTRCPAGRKPAA